MASSSQADKTVTKQGANNEHQVLSLNSESESAETEQIWRDCVKNPNHEKFIPVTDFGKHHLPEGWQDDEVVEFIKLQCNLTVRIRVLRVSTDRPDDGGYYGSKDEQLMGTGFILYPRLTFRCPCKDHYGKGKKETAWIFYISTANHVVYDFHETERERTRVDLFFDDDLARDEGRAVTLKSVAMLHAEIDRDNCIFACYCHDLDLGTKVRDDHRKYQELGEKIGKRPKLSLPAPAPVVIASHPHGRPKHITLGEMDEEEMVREPYIYRVDTCKGSSGARVCGLGWPLEEMWPLAGAVHCKKSEDPGLNKGYYNCFLFDGVQFKALY